jgi:hypothetical protein
VTYQVNRALGFQRWGVTNPWVFADYGQPQRQRGNVSPMVFQTAGPYLKTAHLGTEPTDVEAELLRRADAELKRGERMERYALAGLTVSALSLFLAYNFYSSRMAARVTVNRRRRPRRRRRTSRR